MWRSPHNLFAVSTRLQQSSDLFRIHQSTDSFRTEPVRRTMSSFPDFSATDRPVQWQRFCDLLWYDKSMGFWLDVSRMYLNQSHFEQLSPRFTRAFQAMIALEKGAIANPDEQRQVGHYWLRSPQLAPEATIANHIKTEIDRVEAFGKCILDESIVTPSGQPFTDVLWIGIGGSGLGPLLIIKALQETGIGLPFYFFDNVDPQGMSRILSELGSRLKTTLIVVVSKSGTTPEPNLGMEQARARLEATGNSWPDQAVAITMSDSKLDQQAKHETWLERFDMFDWVGGRTSITSAVGLLPAALIGADLRSFLAGAAEMDIATRIQDLRCNPAALMAASWYVAGDGRGKRDMVIIPYRDRLEVFSRYLQQLVMESLGKRHDRNGKVVHQGIAVYGNKGSTDQHAYVQQLRDGIDNFFATFIEVLENPSDIPIIHGEYPGDFLDGFLQGTRSALSEGGRQSMTLTIESFNAHSLGALIALFERAVGLYGELINVNAYHQPGVEAGKKAAAAIITLQSRVETFLSDGLFHSIKEIQQNVGSDNTEAIFLILRHLSGSSKKYITKGDWGHPATMQFKLQC
uniref:Glucose-6-phosphate isomerase n=1 Tax=Paulinella longichromatophora TaxID=1708747 RepID=A0A2H4ZNU2_9EUKA|nr:glucose-6-phosphate isomerase [Paulinella longichromatophora]